MNKILIIGAGRSASALIRYTLNQAEIYDWQVTVADHNLSLAQDKVKGSSHGLAREMDIHNEDLRAELIGWADLVLSLLPAFLHIHVAKDCLDLDKHLITASYVSPDMYQLAEQAKRKGLIFMGEMGLDPGLDHMSAMKKIHEIKENGGILDGFYSYTGGLIAPESDTNPWHYKFTWNPRNVILAGQGTAQYLEQGKYKYRPYDRLFAKVKTIDIPDFGPLEMYANRDSLSYRSIYGLDDIQTIVRGTLRYPGFCAAWNALIQIGLTDDTYQIIDAEKLTYKEWVDAYLDAESGDSVEDRTAAFLGVDLDGPVMSKLKWAGLFDEVLIPLKEASPAQILEGLLTEKWKLQDEDKDLIVMQHEFIYTQDGTKTKETSTLIVKGRDSVDTAMSRLVGLPVGILAKLIMLNKIEKVDVHIPVVREIYEPVLAELEEYDVQFIENHVPI